MAFTDSSVIHPFSSVFVLLSPDVNSCLFSCKKVSAVFTRQLPALLFNAEQVEWVFRALFPKNSCLLQQKINAMRMTGAYQKSCWPNRQKISQTSCKLCKPREAVDLGDNSLQVYHSELQCSHYEMFFHIVTFSFQHFKLLIIYNG